MFVYVNVVYVNVTVCLFFVAAMIARLLQSAS
jgi:hypothetical protein